jgi:hypothetical protein
MKYLDLDQKGKVLAEYIWIDAVGGVRSKTKVGIGFLLFASYHTEYERQLPRVSPTLKACAPKLGSDQWWPRSCRWPVLLSVPFLPDLCPLR